MNGEKIEIIKRVEVSIKELKQFNITNLIQKILVLIRHHLQNVFFLSHPRNLPA